MSIKRLKSKPIPITAAKRIAQEYGYDQIVIYARSVDSDVPIEHMTTYGETKAHCKVAAMMGETLRKFMGWNVE